jgi:hypothetical protein
MTTAMFPPTIYSQGLENAYRAFIAIGDGLDTLEARESFMAGWVAMYSHLTMRMGLS